jgi:site-specific DNA recombinase
MVGIYARVSTEEQARSGFSLNDQIRECRRRAGTDQVIEYIDEGVSGEVLDRPALAKLRKDAKDGVIRKIVCLDPDRLSRKLMHQLLITDEFDRWGIQLVFVNGEYGKTPEGVLFYSMRGAIAEFEKAKINEQMSRGRREKARQGKVLRDFRIYGYNYDRTTQQLVVNEAEAEVVRLVFALFTKPNDKVQGINGIAKYLTERGVPTKRGADVWHRQVVRQMLSNRAYIGEFYQNRWDTEGMLGNKHKPPKERRTMRIRPQTEWIRLPCPAIVEPEVFEQAQQLLMESRRRWAGKSSHSYLLSGLVRCGDCGNTMTGRLAKRWKTAIYRYSDRKSTMGAKKPGCGRSISADELERQVWDAVLAWLRQPESIAETIGLQLDKDLSAEQREIARLEKELEKTKAGRKRLLNLLIENDLQQDLQAAIRELKQREKQLGSQLAELRKQADQAPQPQDLHRFWREAVCYYLQTAPDELNFADKRELLRRVIREIRVYSDKMELHLF